MNFPILSSLILLPTLGALFIFFVRSSSGKYQASKYLSLFISIANFFLSIYLWYIFDKNSVDFQFVENKEWLSGFVNYKVGIDGISILFIILTTFITPICIISTQPKRRRPSVRAVSTNFRDEISVTCKKIKVSAFENQDPS